MVDEDRSLANTEQLALAIPMMPIEELTKLTNYVAQVKETLMTKNKDYFIQGNKQYTARSGFAKLAQGFDLSDEILLEKEIYQDGRFYGFNYTVCVYNRLGRRSTGVGSCTIDEPNLIHHKDRPYHDVRSIAFTRAWNRAVSNFVGSADVSAEEMSLGPEFDTPQRKAPEDAVRVQDFMKPVELKLPEWLLADELNRAEDSWDQAKEMTEGWMKAAGFNLDDFEVKSDTVKITVKPIKAIPAEAMPDITGVMLAAGFIQRNRIFRLNRKDVIG
ncbi:MAG TPA: hypothetical protein VMW50_03235 [Dehalococcoidia bacterium]|nr:hypothetical protein [Dehalococcoidia bacterium]